MIARQCKQLRKEQLQRELREIYSDMVLILRRAKEEEHFFRVYPRHCKDEYIFLVGRKFCDKLEEIQPRLNRIWMEKDRIGDYVVEDKQIREGQLLRELNKILSNVIPRIRLIYEGQHKIETNDSNFGDQRISELRKELKEIIPKLQSNAIAMCEEQHKIRTNDRSSEDQIRDEQPQQKLRKILNDMVPGMQQICEEQLQRELRKILNETVPRLRQINEELHKIRTIEIIYIE
ncbi:PREDICTED: uncharacterized protein LOC105456275 [Wasmannia auropunctata]|uniref:uncharacterized protein LOC105456275 n=1 Tax=Wasmannia auropunctata TaxID=64793 RepID=UPI0005EE97FF|nr:PREDICTED: uncharacterized protein LOC105456275 [Wasmannia auropunctata]